MSELNPEPTPEHTGLQMDVVGDGEFVELLDPTNKTVYGDELARLQVRGVDLTAARKAQEQAMLRSYGKVFRAQLSGNGLQPKLDEDK